MNEPTMVPQEEETKDGVTGSPAKAMNRIDVATMLKRIFVSHHPSQVKPWY